MSFLAGREVAEAVNRSIIESLEAREAKMCDTWDRDNALGVAYALKAELSQDEADEIKTYVQKISGSEILIDDKVRVEIIKGDVKVKKDSALMIVRYRHIEGF